MKIFALTTQPEPDKLSSTFRCIIRQEVYTNQSSYLLSADRSVVTGQLHYKITLSSVKKRIYLSSNLIKYPDQDSAQYMILWTNHYISFDTIGL